MRHMAGDQVKTAASVLRSQIREVDVFARYGGGGEEFALLLPETPGAMAAQLAEKIRAAVPNSRVIFEERVIRMTVSMGVAEVVPELSNPQQLVKQPTRASTMPSEKAETWSRCERLKRSRAQCWNRSATSAR